METCPHLPRITIITPSFNQGNYIRKTIDSVLSQGYPDLEYLVMDGGSTDETLGILQSYQAKLRFISERDRGQSHAINKGLRLATGEVINYLNSDDLLEPGALLKVGHFFAARPEASWLAGRCRIIDPEGKEVRKIITFYKNFWLYFRSYRVLQVLDFISQPATFWRRQVFEKVGAFDVSLHYAMDYDFSLRVGRYYRLWATSLYLASFRIQPTSKSTLKPDAHFAEEYAVLKRYLASPFYLAAHALHNQFIVSIYKLLSSGAA